MSVRESDDESVAAQINQDDEEPDVVMNIGVARDNQLNRQMNHLSFSINDNINHIELNLRVMKVSGQLNSNIINHSVEVPRGYSSIDLGKKKDHQSIRPKPR